MLLSKIKYTNIIPNSSKSDLENIVYTPNNIITEKTDIGIVIGGISMVPNRIDEGIKLYEKGLVDRLALCGGVRHFNRYRQTADAHIMEFYLLKNDLVDYDIIIESESRSTLESIYNLLEILKNDYNLEKTKFTIITSDFELKRCIGILTNELVNNYNIYGIGCKDGVTDKENWYNSFFGRRLILEEALKLCHYARDKKIKDYEIENLSFDKNIHI